MKQVILTKILFFIFIFLVVLIFILPFLIRQLKAIDQTEAIGWEEDTIYVAAKRYVLDHGAPMKDMDTTEVKNALIPFYLNHWPKENAISCTIDNEGNIKIHSPDARKSSLYWFENRFYHR